jgi:hypothetical protein
MGTNRGRGSSKRVGLDLNRAFCFLALHLLVSDLVESLRPRTAPEGFLLVGLCSPVGVFFWSCGLLVCVSVSVRVVGLCFLVWVAGGPGCGVRKRG